MLQSDNNIATKIWQGVCQSRSLQCCTWFCTSYVQKMRNKLLWPLFLFMGTCWPRLTSRRSLLWPKWFQIKVGLKNLKKIEQVHNFNSNSMVTSYFDSDLIWPFLRSLFYQMGSKTHQIIFYIVKIPIWQFTFYDLTYDLDIDLQVVTCSWNILVWKNLWNDKKINAEHNCYEDHVNILTLLTSALGQSDNLQRSNGYII
jgi:hypothetical protein